MKSGTVGAGGEGIERAAWCNRRNQEAGSMATEGSETATSPMDYVKVVALFLTVISIFLGVCQFNVNVKRDRERQTLDYWERINQALKQEKRELKNKINVDLRDDTQMACENKIEHDMAMKILDNDKLSVKTNRIINRYERLALGVNIGAYDVRVLNRLVGQNIIDNYCRFEAYIEARREKLNRPYAWKEFEKLTNKLKTLREKNSEGVCGFCGFTF